jgi:hypothetical protein
MFINNASRYNSKSYKTANTKILNVHQLKEGFYKFKMSTINILNALDRLNPICNTAMNRFFGIMAPPNSKPKLYLNTVSKETEIKVSKTWEYLWDTHYLLLSMELYRRYHGSVLTPYYFIERRVFSRYHWLPQLVKPDQGQIYCIFNQPGEDDNVYLFSWHEPVFKYNWDETWSVAYDPNVEFLPVQEPELIETDNVAEWHDYVYRLSANIPRTIIPEPLDCGFKSAWGSLLTEYYELFIDKATLQKRNKEAAILDIIWKDVIPVETDKLYNFSLLHSEQYDQHKFMENLDMVRLFGGTTSHNGNQFSELTHIDPSSLQDDSFSYQNVQAQNVTTLPMLWGAPKLSENELRKTLYNVVRESKFTPVQNDDYRFLGPNPGVEPIIVPKSDAKPITEKIERFDDHVAGKYGSHIKSKHTGSSHNSEVAIELEVDSNNEQMIAAQTWIESSISLLLQQIYGDHIEWLSDEPIKKKPTKDKENGNEDKSNGKKDNGDDDNDNGDGTDHDNDGNTSDDYMSSDERVETVDDIHKDPVGKHSQILFRFQPKWKISKSTLKDIGTLAVYEPEVMQILCAPQVKMDEELLALNQALYAKRKEEEKKQMEASNLSKESSPQSSQTSSQTNPPKK